MPLSLLGGLTITGPAGAAVALPTRKTALVLAALALLGDKGASRETLVEWIWPDRSDGQGKSSLRQALTAIRKALPAVLQGAALMTEHDSIRLTGPDTGIDLRAFEALARADAAAERRRAAGLYAGDLLEGVQLTEPLANFVAAHRERLRRQALALVETLSEADAADPQSRAACEALANCLLAGDPAAEAAHRALIRLRLAEGQPNAARRQLDRCIDAVERELGVAPEVRTTALLEGRIGAATGAPAIGVPGTTAPLKPVSQPQRPHGQPSVVVMPFDDLGGGSDDFFADGVVEEITAALSRIRDFFVIARQSAYTYKGRFVDVREIGRDLGVAYAVEGTVRRGGGRVRITVQLVDTETGRQLWSDRFEDASSGLFELQDRIASRVAGAINPSIRASEIERAKRQAPENLQAYDLALRALPHFWAHRKEDNEKALGLFDQALAKDPDYGVALAFKAWCHAQQTAYLWAEDPAAERARALAAADRAALLVHDHATALAAIGAAYSLCTTDQPHALSFIERALALDPNNAWGWMRAGWLRTLNGQMKVAIACFERALALSPFDPFTFNIYFGMGLAYAELGDFARAIELVEKGLHSGPGVTWAYRMLAAYHALAGNQEKAAAALAEFLRHNPGTTMEKLLHGMPPSLIANQPRYMEGLRKAGMPER